MANKYLQTRGESALLKALACALRPLVRLMIQRRITYPVVCELLKRLFVEVAGADFRAPGKAVNFSGISFLTGIHRKDVRRLSEPGMRAHDIDSDSLDRALLERWCSTSKYQDLDGKPRALPRFGNHFATFEGLVASLSRDIRPRAVLDNGVQLGLFTVDAADRVSLNTGPVLETDGFIENAYYFGRNLRDHIAAGVENLGQDRPAFTDRSIHYHGLTRRSIEELKTLAGERGLAALKTVNQRAIELHQRDTRDPAAIRRINFGIYCFDSDELTGSSSAGPM